VTSAWRIEVDEFDASTAPHIIHRVTRTPSTINRSRLIGLGGTLILHGLVVPMFIPTPLIHQKRPLDSAGTSVSQPVTAPADELVLLTIDSSKKDDAALEATTIDLRSQLAKSAIPLVVPDQAPVIDLSSANAEAENSPQSDTSPGDAELRALMYGRYTGQIGARIERAWEKPRSPVNDLKTARSSDAVDPDPFVCQVQIRQDNQGNVQEVLLLACNGTEAWRHSLVVAINQSSPLPAPPIPTVFKRAITMTFEGRVDRHGALPEAIDVAPRGESR
jgi:TonB C terminal